MARQTRNTLDQRALEHFQVDGQRLGKRSKSGARVHDKQDHGALLQTSPGP